MVLSLKSERLKRYKDIVALLVKYGRSDLVNQSDITPAEGLSREQIATADEKASELASDLEALGPTFIKLGQLLSTRGDLLPEPYIEALERLQDQIEPFPYEEVERIVSSELGGRLSKLFLEFKTEPFAAASLAQVHRATMRDGRAVVVKVQRPAIREQIVEDLEALGQVAEFIDAHTEIGKRYEFTNMLADLRGSLLHELDFHREGTNLHKLRKSLREFENIIIPEPIDDYTTARVLSMEYIPGKKITEVSPLRFMDIDTAGLAEEVFRAYLKQILVDGFFHADPHPGNVFVTPDYRIALLDLGMVGRIMPRLQEDLLQLLIAISEGDGEDASQIAIKIGQPRREFDQTEFTRRISEIVAQQKTATVEEMQVGRLVLEVTRCAVES